MIRPLFVAWSGVVSGELLYAAMDQSWHYILLSLSIMLVLAFSFKYDKGKAYGSCFVLCLFLGIILLHFVSHIDLKVADFEEDARGVLSGTVIQTRYDQEEGKLKFVLKDSCFVQEKHKYKLNKNCMVFLSGTDGEYGIPACGDSVIIHGEIALPEAPHNPGQFHAQHYYRAQGIYYLFYGQNYRLVRRPAICIRRYADNLRREVDSIYGALYTKEQESLLNAIVLGDKTKLSDDMKKLYEENGVAHLLALSGLHVSIVGGRVYRFLRRRKLSYMLSCSLSFLIILFYGIMTGFGSSVMRAILMFVIFLGAEYFGADYDLLSSMSLSGILMLLEHPYRALEGGYLISFASILAIGTVLPMVQIFIQRYRRERAGQGLLAKNEFFAALAPRLMESAAIYIVTCPVTMFFFYENTPYCILLNMIVLPLMPPLMLSAIFAGLCGLLGKYLLKPLWQISILLGWPASFMLTIQQKCFYIFRRLPGALWITGRPSVVLIFVIYLLEGIALWLLWQGLWKRMLLLLLMTLGLAMILPHRRLRITMLDIGQGDCILFQTAEGHTALIDGGSTSQKDIYRYILKPAMSYYGIAHLDYVVATHTDEDHISGIRDLLEAHFPVGTFITGDENEEDHSLTDAALANRTEIVYLKRGDQLQLGTVRLSCLYPYKGLQVDDKNDKSVVLYMAYGMFRGLFTGDLSSEHEEDVMRAVGENRPVTLLKVGHHGSKYSTSDEFLDYFKPVNAVISCGEGNRYGHPHPETLERLQQAGSRVFRTDREGAIEVVVRQRDYSIHSFLKDTEEK